MSKKSIEYEVLVHRVADDSDFRHVDELDVVLQRSENLEQMIQYALQIFASSIVKLVTVAEVVDGEFNENKVTLCR